ncbi:MAG: hypothetical protein IH614_12355 [Desulfuromonadales bacterium]|nr:hypothetical protein [Desulfuromonadales bacterium]
MSAGKWWLASLLLTPWAFAAWGSEVVLVVNRENPVSSLSRQEAVQIFLGKKTTWEGNGKIELYVQLEESVNEEFIPALVNKSPRQFFLYWKRIVFSGTGLPPLQVRGDQEMKRAIAADRHGIGYIKADSLDPAVKRLELR